MLTQNKDVAMVGRFGKVYTGILVIVFSIMQCTETSESTLFYQNHVNDLEIAMFSNVEIFPIRSKYIGIRLYDYEGYYLRIVRDSLNAENLPRIAEPEYHRSKLEGNVPFEYSKLEKIASELILKYYSLDVLAISGVDVNGSIEFILHPELVVTYIYDENSFYNFTHEYIYFVRK